jgi:flagellar motility protein MotE (MotC chaperone)
MIRLTYCPAMHMTPRSVLVALACLLLLIIPGARAEETPAIPAAGSDQSEIQRFCSNIVDAARDQRYLLQKQDLEKLQADVDARIKMLEDRKKEYEDWLKRRNDFLESADAGLLEIYQTMKPDIAGPQLELVNVNVAAALLMKLPPKNSSKILSKMAPDKAAALTGIIASITAIPKVKDQP